MTVSQKHIALFQLVVRRRIEDTGGCCYCRRPSAPRRSGGLYVGDRGSSFARSYTAAIAQHQRRALKAKETRRYEQSTYAWEAACWGQCHHRYTSARPASLSRPHAAPHHFDAHLLRSRGHEKFSKKWDDLSIGHKKSSRPGLLG